MNNNWYRSRSLFTQPRKPQPPRKKWRIRHVLVTALKRTCMAIGAMVLISATLSLILSAMMMREMEAPALPDEMVLFLPLEHAMLEHEDGASPYSLTEKNLTIRNAVAAIDFAARDNRVKGLVTKIEGGALNLAHLEELRAAILRFRESGKFAYVYATSYGTMSDYHLASAHEEIWLQPMGIVSIPGIMIEMPYARTVLETIGVEPQVFAREEYKNFFESFTSTEMSPASRRMMNAIVDDISDRTVLAIAAARDMEEGAVQALVDKALFTGEEALQAGLIDRLDYADSFNRHVKQIVKDDPGNDEKIFATIHAYAKDVAARRGFGEVGVKKPKVALIYVVGQLIENDDGGNHLSASSKLVSYIQDAAEDKSIRTIVLRIDSPGGSPVAAEAVRRAVANARDEGVNVIVSMGASAASGGYWIAADADRIFALPSTFTGSIGVTGGKFSLQEMWNKIGVNWDTVRWGENAGLWSFNRPFSESEAERMNAMMDNVYQNFLARVAEGRDMSVEQVRAIAGGRVWTGNQALEIGLVDELGGLDEALDYVAELHGLKSRHDLHIALMPRPKTPLERIIQLFEGQVQASAFFGRHQDTLTRLDSLLGRIDAAARMPGVTASAPEWELAR